MKTKPSRMLADMPDTFKGSKKQYGRMIRSAILPADPNRTWWKNEETGKWVRQVSNN